MSDIYVIVVKEQDCDPYVLPNAASANPARAQELMLARMEELVDEFTQQDAEEGNEPRAYMISIAQDKMSGAILLDEEDRQRELATFWVQVTSVE